MPLSVDPKRVPHHVPSPAKEPENEFAAKMVDQAKVDKIGAEDMDRPDEFEDAGRYFRSGDPSPKAGQAQDEHRAENGEVPDFLAGVVFSLEIAFAPTEPKFEPGFPPVKVGWSEGGNAGH